MANFIPTTESLRQIANRYSKMSPSLISSIRAAIEETLDEDFEIEKNPSREQYEEYEEYEDEDLSYDEEDETGEEDEMYSCAERFSGFGKNKTTSMLAATLEDRNNDWLAKQIREEAQLKSNLYDIGTLRDIASNLTSLGVSHRASCDARKLKTEHHIRHMLGRD